MIPSVEQIEELLNLMREADVATLRAFDRRLRLLLEEKEAAQLGPGQGKDAREEFHQRHPRITIAPELFALVGIHPANPLEEDKALIREQIARRLVG